VEQNVLQSVKDSRKKKFESKLESLKNDNWSRSNFQQRHKQVETIIENVEDLLRDLRSEIEKKQQKKESIKNDYGKSDLAQLETRMDGKYDATLKQLKDVSQRISVLRRREKEWKAYQQQVERISHARLLELVEGYRRDFEGSDVAKNVKQSMDNYVDSKFETLEQAMHRKIDNRINAVEKVVDAVRTEMKFYRDYLEKHGEGSVEALETHSESISDLVDLLNEMQDGGMVDLPTDDDGHVDLSPEEDVDDDGDVEPSESGLDAVNTVFEGDASSSGRESGGSSSSAGAGDDEPEYVLKGKSIDEQYQVLEKLAEKHPIDELTQREVADLTDVAKTSIFSSGRILDKIEEEFGKDLNFR
jgi:hypothetical protein